VCDCQIPHQSLLELVRTVGHIHSKFRGACTTGDIRRLLDIVGPLALYPGEEERRISPLQKKVLKVIEKLVIPPPVPAFWTFRSSHTRYRTHGTHVQFSCRSPTRSTRWCSSS
jgi:hypothetical protein